MKKRLVFVLLIVTLVAGICGCGKKDKNTTVTVNESSVVEADK